MTLRVPASGAAIGFTAPSSYLVDPLQMDRAAAWFGTRGWRVQAGDTCFGRHARFSAPDAERAAEFNRFAADRGLDVVMAARGGYGLTRILDRIDFAAAARAGRLICGFSDFTAFNLGLLATTGAVSLHGPSATDFGAPEVDPFTAEHFLAAVATPRGEAAFAVDGPDTAVSGVLWGGNLALICALVGTPWFPEVRGGILFIEDVAEAAYRIDRMLVQLAQAGILGRQKAILLGSFEPLPVLANDNGFDRASVVDDLRERLDVPVIDGLPFGHVPRKLTLPIGAAAALQVERGQAVLSWDRSDAPLRRERSA